jgi:hypothetical protein
VPEEVELKQVVPSPTSGPVTQSRLWVLLNQWKLETVQEVGMGQLVGGVTEEAVLDVLLVVVVLLLGRVVEVLVELLAEVVEILLVRVVEVLLVLAKVEDEGVALVVLVLVVEVGVDEGVADVVEPEAMQAAS